MKAGRIIAIILAALLALPAFGAIIGGAVLSIAYAVERGDDGYFDETLERVGTTTSAITTEGADFRTDPGPGWVLDFLDADVRIQVSGPDVEAELFVGIGPEDAVEQYLSGVSRDEIRDVDFGGDVEYRTIPGDAEATPPAEQEFWAASASGAGPLVLEWEVEEGHWIAVLMNADGSRGLIADVTVGIWSSAVLAIGIGMLVIGLLVLAIAVAIILAAVLRPERDREEAPAGAPSPLQPEPTASYPLQLGATIDAPLSPWLWLVKWLLAIPHFIVLAFLWLAFSVLTVLAGVAILFTGRYPRGIFDFNVGVMRWSWRVVAYAASGGLFTDRYPPFSLAPEPGYPATLDVDYPDRLSRGLVLVKWWLLAIPHYLVLAFVAGWWWTDGWFLDVTVGGGLLGVLVLIAAVVLLFTNRYPRPLFDLIVGLNRWGFRVFAYAALMTDEYPPFRLDQGGGEPGSAGARSMRMNAR